MKWIAHRGASLEMPENTLASLRLGSALGAYAVECDVRRTADGEYVIYHDSTLAPLTGGTDNRPVESLTCTELAATLRSHGRTLMRFSDVLSYYRSRAAVLLHIYLSPEDLTDTFLRSMADAPFRFLCGVPNAAYVRACGRYFPPEQILAFMDDKNAYRDCFAAGAGNIRLWEGWLSEITPDMVHDVCPGADVWIMSSRPETGMNGSVASFETLVPLHADGILLNDIRLGVTYAKAHGIEIEL